MHMVEPLKQTQRQRGTEGNECQVVSKDQGALSGVECASDNFGQRRLAGETVSVRPNPDVKPQSG